MATDKRAAKRKLEELLMTRNGHLRYLDACRKKGDAAGEARCDQVLKRYDELIRGHCVEHDLELPHDVPSESAE